MPTDKQPRNSAAKKTTKNATRVPTNSEPVSTAGPTAGTARNAVIEGNGTQDLDEIRKRAYELYEEDGRPEGRHEDHWHRAEREIAAEEAGSSKAPRRAASPRKAPGKPAAAASAAATPARSRGSGGETRAPKTAAPKAPARSRKPAAED